VYLSADKSAVTDDQALEPELPGSFTNLLSEYHLIHAKVPSLKAWRLTGHK